MQSQDSLLLAVVDSIEESEDTFPSLRHQTSSKVIIPSSDPPPPVKRIQIRKLEYASSISVNQSHTLDSTDMEVSQSDDNDDHSPSMLSSHGSQTISPMGSNRMSGLAKNEGDQEESTMMPNGGPPLAARFQKLAREVDRLESVSRGGLDRSHSIPANSISRQISLTISERSHRDVTSNAIKCSHGYFTDHLWTTVISSVLDDILTCLLEDQVIDQIYAALAWALHSSHIVTHRKSRCSQPKKKRPGFAKIFFTKVVKQSPSGVPRALRYPAWDYILMNSRSPSRRGLEFSNVKKMDDFTESLLDNDVRRVRSGVKGFKRLEWQNAIKLMVKYYCATTPGVWYRSELTEVAAPFVHLMSLIDRPDIHSIPKASIQDLKSRLRPRLPTSPPTPSSPSTSSTGWRVDSKSRSRKEQRLIRNPERPSKSGTAAKKHRKKEIYEKEDREKNEGSNSNPTKTYDISSNDVTKLLAVLSKDVILKIPAPVSVTSNPNKPKEINSVKKSKSSEMISIWNGYSDTEGITGFCSLSSATRLFEKMMSIYLKDLLFHSQGTLLENYLGAFRMVIRWYDPRLYYRIKQVPSDHYVGGWFRTLFANKVGLPFLLILWDYIFVEQDGQFIIFLAAALLLMHRQEILITDPSHLPSSLSSLDVRSCEGVKVLFELARFLKREAPEQILEQVKITIYNRLNTSREASSNFASQDSIVSQLITDEDYEEDIPIYVSVKEVMTRTYRKEIGVVPLANNLSDELSPFAGGEWLVIDFVGPQEDRNGMGTLPLSVQLRHVDFRNNQKGYEKILRICKDRNVIWNETFGPKKPQTTNATDENCNQDQVSTTSTPEKNCVDGLRVVVILCDDEFLRRDVHQYLSYHRVPMVCLMRGGYRVAHDIIVRNNGKGEFAEKILLKNHHQSQCQFCSAKEDGCNFIFPSIFMNDKKRESEKHWTMKDDDDSELYSYPWAALIRAQNETFFDLRDPMYGSASDQESFSSPKGRHRQEGPQRSTSRRKKNKKKKGWKLGIGKVGRTGMKTINKSLTWAK